MATIGNNVLTLTDWAKRNDPKGKTPMIVEMLSQSNMALEDINKMRLIELMVCQMQKLKNYKQ